MKHLNEKHTWFNLDKNNEGCVLRYTTIDGSMLAEGYINNLKRDRDEKIIHKYGIIVFEKPLTSISDYAFSRSEKLSSVIIPDSVDYIGFSVFRECSNLVSITLPNNMIEIKKAHLRVV